MNAAALLICPTAGAAATAAGAGATSGAEAPTEEGFASALASSIAGMAKQASAPDGSVTESLQAADTAEDPTLADVMQWLCLPGAAPMPTADAATGDAVDSTADEVSLEPQQQALALATRSAPRGAPTASSGAAPEETPEGDAPAVLPGAPAPETAASATGSATASPMPGSSLPQAPHVQPLAALATALVRDGATTTANATGGTAVHASLREHVGTARWADELGSRLVLMSVRGQQEGSLTLTPEHLGPLEVQISVNKDTASVWFGAQNADTRTALTEALPRLRELFAASGLSLGQAGVSEQAPRREAPGSETIRGIGASEEGVSGGEAAEPAWRPMRAGLIDTYA